MKQPIISYIGLGSNLDRPILQLKTGIASLQQLPDTQFLSGSHFYQTVPIGFAHQPDFINAVVALKTTLSAQKLLQALQKIENTQGRIRSSEKNAARTLDLDLLLYGENVFDQSTPGLIVPHPRLEVRAFVLVPLLEIAPHLVLPNGKQVRDCLSALGDTRMLCRRLPRACLKSD